MKETPNIKEIYRHYKTNGLYEILEIAQHTEIDQQLVIYKSLKNNSIWARPLEIFNESVINDKGERVERFQKVIL